MWPWGHLAVGYLIYSLYSHRIRGQPPSDYAVVALAIGTQFPDAVDKPLAWTAGVLPNGRSLAHSILVATLVIWVLYIVVRSHQQFLVTAFSIGYLAHLFGDALYPLIDGDISALGFLAWPLVPALEYSTDKSFLAHFLSLELTSFVAFELALSLFVFGIWIYDGLPGSRLLIHAVYTGLQRLSAPR